MYRIFWTPNKSWAFFKASDGTALNKHIQRANRVDCFYSLNVYLNYEERTCHYDMGFDFDSTDIRASARDAAILSRRLQQLSVPFDTYFSGSKGVHLFVPYEVANVSPRGDGGHVTKLFQRALKEELHLTTLDTEIHCTKRMWRCANTINSKSGLYKVPITLDELCNTEREGLEFISSLASSPRERLTLPIPSTPVAQFVELVQPFVAIADTENHRHKERLEQRKAITLSSIPICVTGILNNPRKVVRQAETWLKRAPSRNDLTFVAATFLRSHAGMSEDEVLNILGEEWQHRVAQISNSNLMQIARSTKTAVQAVFTGTYEFSCGNAISKGCDCWAGCPLFQKRNGSTTEGTAEAKRPRLDGTPRGVDQ